MPDSRIDITPHAGRQRRALLKLATAVPLVALAGACSQLVPGQRPPPALYSLTPKSTFRPDLPQVDWQLVLEPPIAAANLNSTRIALQRDPMSMEYYARSTWADRAPLMVQTLMIESFENSQRIVAVGREAIGLRADYLLKTELREFQAIYYGRALPEALIVINAKLVQMPQRSIIGSQSFSHSTAVAADRLDDIITAFDASLGKVLRRLVEWVLLTGESSWRARRG